MKRLILLIFLMGVVAFAQTPISPWKVVNGYVVNAIGDSTGVVTQNGDTIWISNAGLHWNGGAVLDSALLDSIYNVLGRFSGRAIDSVDGYDNGGINAAHIATGGVATAEILNQTIDKTDVDSTATFVIGRGYEVTSATPAFELATLDDIHDSLVGFNATIDNIIDPFIIGDVSIIGPIHQQDVIRLLDTNISVQTNVIAKLNLPQYRPDWTSTDSARFMDTVGVDSHTPTNPDSSHAIHPAGIAAPWPGGLWPTCLNDKVVLGYGPICISESDENPHLAGSNDGVSFSELVFDTNGDGVSDDTLYNPVVWYKDTFLVGWGAIPDTFYGTGAGNHFSDQDLFNAIDVDSVYRTYLPARFTWGTNDSQSISFMDTYDGLNWSQPRFTISVGLTPDVTANTDLISPSFLQDTSRTWEMWAIEKAESGDSTWIVKWETGTKADSGWAMSDRPGERDTVSYAPFNAGYKAWHMNMFKHGSQKWSWVTETPDGETGDSSKLVLAHVSEDGWVIRGVANVVLPSFAVDKDSSTIYRSWSYFEDRGSSVVMILYYSQKGNVTSGGGGRAWGMSRLEASLSSIMIDDIAAFTESELENNMSDVTSIFTNNITGDVTVGPSTSVIGVDRVDSANVGANALAESDINWKSEYISLDVVHGKGLIPTDSVVLSFPHEVDVLFSDSSFYGSGMVDTIWVSGSIPFDCVSADSLIFTYKGDGSAVIDKVELFGATRAGTFTNIPDSSYYSNDINLTSSSWVRVAYYINEGTINAGENFSLRFITTLTNINDWIRVSSVQMRVQR